MKAEHRKALEKNELAAKLNTVWEGVSSTSPRANRTFLVIIILFMVAVAWYFYSTYSASQDASLWGSLDFANDTKALQKIIEESPNSIQAQIARFHIARSNLEEATNKLASQQSDERTNAAELLEGVRKTYGDLAAVSSLPSILSQEAMMERAKVEEILASVPKADNATVMRGSLDQAIKYYDETAQRFSKSFIGEEAKKRCEHLKANKSDIEKMYAELAKDHAAAAATPAGPSLPGLSPEAPK